MIKVYGYLIGLHVCLLVVVPQMEMYSVFLVVKRDLEFGYIGRPMYLMCHVLYACSWIVQL
jgi:hypothetical protein